MLIEEVPEKRRHVGIRGVHLVHHQEETQHGSGPHLRMPHPQPAEQGLVNRSDHDRPRQVALCVFDCPTPLPNVLVVPQDPPGFRKGYSFLVVHAQIAGHRQSDRRGGIAKPAGDHLLDAGVDLHRGGARREGEVHPVHLALAEEAEEVNQGRLGLPGTSFRFKGHDLSRAGQAVCQEGALRGTGQPELRKQGMKVQREFPGGRPSSHRIPPPLPDDVPSRGSRRGNPQSCLGPALAREREVVVIRTEPVGQYHQPSQGVEKPGGGGKRVPAPGEGVRKHLLQDRHDLG